MIPCTEKSMTVELPGEPVSASPIAARSEPGPESLRFRTTMICEDAEAEADVSDASAAAGVPVETAAAVEAPAAMQAAPAIRSRAPVALGPAQDGLLGRNLVRVERANILGLLP
jgi:hypothetical protein